MPFGASERVLERAAQAAEGVRGNLGLEGPVSAFEVAKRLDMQVVLTRHIEQRGFTIDGEPKLWVREGDRTTRLEHACAHEIGHHHVFDQDAEPKLLERACDRFAAELLLPRAEFADSVRQIGLDPRLIQRTWRFSSLEAIARRIAEVVPGAAASAWLELEEKWHEGKPPVELARRQLEALGDAYHRPRGVGVVECAAGIVRVWRTGSAPRTAVSVLQVA